MVRKQSRRVKEHKGYQASMKPPDKNDNTCILYNTPQNQSSRVPVQARKAFASVMRRGAPARAAEWLGWAYRLGAPVARCVKVGDEDKTCALVCHASEGGAEVIDESDHWE